MRRPLWLRVLSWVTLATLAVVVPAPSHAQDGESRLERQMAASAARQAREAERARVARQRWEQERRRSAAHARMPDTMYASTPSAPAVELSCPVVTDDDVRRAVQGWGDEVSSSPFSSADGLAARDGGVFRAPPLQGVLGSSWLSGEDASAESASHDAWSATVATASNSDTTSHLVPLFPSASDAALQGFARVINHSGESGEVQIDAIDDTGVSYGPLTLSIDGDATVHFNSDDLETGNADKGLSGGTGAGQGDWYLELASDLDIEVLSYIRTTDGFLTSMHDLAPAAEGEHRIAIFNPGSNDRQVSRLRLINAGDAEAQVTIEGVDDRGLSPGGAVQVTVAAGAARTLTAAELEFGGTGLTGALGNGTGKWRLTVRSESSINAMSLLKSPTGHLTNLSTAPSLEADGVHAVSMFPSASDATLQGFVRVRNRGDTAAQVTVRAYDDTDWTYEPLTLTVAAGAVAPFNSDDLEQGNADKGLTGSTGAGEGDWRLALTSESDIEVLAYTRTTDGFLTAMHDAAPVAGTRHRVAIFNPGANDRQVSWLRIVNAGDAAAAVTITGIDDSGGSPGSAVQVSVPAGAARAYTAAQLESGGEGLEGALGDGVGKWRLEVASDQPIRVLSLLSSPTGHLTNLSTATARGNGMGTAEDVFRTLISPIVQSKCVNCHVEGGVSGNTRLVFVTDSDADHLATNFSVFETLLEEVEGGAQLILNKVQGVSHGGGIQLAAGTEEFSNMELFLGLLEGEDVGPVAIAPANLFDGVKMASSRNILRRAAIIFAGRIPTEEEYKSIRGASAVEFREAIRGLMQGPEFHEFLIRAANDRLLTDREQDEVISASLVNYTNTIYDLTVQAESSDDRPLRRWDNGVHHGVTRAPLELVAFVVENDLPYTEILTADYVMANPMTATVYGATTEFDDPTDVHEFRPSRMVDYFRQCEGQVVQQRDLGDYVVDPGPCATRYPHAGVLSDKIFLLRYPTTATNRNRARARWTYHHFLGFDVEKSASRTTDPVALADTNNPTMNNPACTVCHSVLDPVAGTFQDFGEDGDYRDQWGGTDSLDRLYTEDNDGWIVAEHTLEVTASRADPHVISMTGELNAGSARLLVVPRFDPPEEQDSEIWWHMGIDHVEIRDSHGDVIDHLELQEQVEQLQLCGPSDDQPSDYYSPWFCDQRIPINIPERGVYGVEMVVWFEGQHRDVTTQRRMLDITLETGGYYVEGDTWYRDMRDPGFNGTQTPTANNSLQWLSQQIVRDDRFAEATVKFWWPAILGSEAAEPPEDQDDPGFEGLLLASNAQRSEIKRLARGFRQGFRDRSPYDLKDLLVEIVLSRWFRADSIGGEDRVRATALANAGAKRLLTPEELARKTLALTGFQKGRQQTEFSADWRVIHENAWNWLTDQEAGHGLLYGGIDSDGITRRASDITSTMAAVAQSHAIESSCPVVMREFYVLSTGERRLFRDIDTGITPVIEFSSAFEVEASSEFEKQTLSVGGPLSAGAQNAKLTFTNATWDEEIQKYRKLRVDRLEVRDSFGELVYAKELEELEPVGEHNGPAGDFYWFHVSGSLDVPFSIPGGGQYSVEVVAWGDQAGDELPELQIHVESDTQRSAGSASIRGKLVELYDTLHGIEVSVGSREVVNAYELFVDVWNRRRVSENADFFGWNEGIDCDWRSDQHYLDGIVNDAFVYRDDWAWGEGYWWDWDRIEPHFESIDWSDPHGVAETWTMVLAYLMMDYRYLYL